MGDQPGMPSAPAQTFCPDCGGIVPVDQATCPTCNYDMVGSVAGR